MLVRDLMTEDVVTAEADSSLEDAARAMLTAGVGSVIVTRDGTPTGILTESDALAAGCATGVPFEEIPLAEAMSGPLETIQPDVTVRAAVERMEAEDIKKLPVLDGMDLLGILTMTDVVQSYHDIVREAHRLDERREGWESKHLTEADISELSRDR